MASRVVDSGSGASPHREPEWSSVTCRLGISSMGSRGSYRTPILTAASVAAALWTYACGEGGTEPPPVDPPRPTTVAVAPDTVIAYCPG